MVDRRADLFSWTRRATVPAPYGERAIRDLIQVLQAAVASRYQIEKEIGRGGAARVYRARDIPHQRAVAIKVLRPELAISPDRFLREILIIARLQHPHIVPLFDSGEGDGVLYYVMPLVEGQSLRKRLEGAQQIPVSLAVGIALEAADALAYAHSHGLVHRDVKPENILLSAGHVMLSDFGIARAIERSVDSLSTGSGIAVGTPAYMSPEQAAGDHAIDERSDQYSLACVLYEMLGGRTPFEGTTPQTIQLRAASGAFVDLRTLRSDIPEPVAAAVQRALSADPAERFESVASFAAALMDERGPGRFASPRALRALAGIAALVAVVAGGIAIANIVKPQVNSRAALHALDPRRIAVLYFDDHSPDKSLDYLANGLTEGLIHELSGVGPMQVISRNGVKPFRDRAAPMDSIALLLRVGSVVEGSVQRSGDSLRVTVQLIDTRSGAHLESSTLDGQMGELFRLQDDLARRVSSLLRRRIGIEVRVRETELATRSARARELVWRAERMRDESSRLAASRDTLDLKRAIALGQSADSILALAERADRRWILPVVERGWVALDLARRQPRPRREPYFDSSLAHARRALARDSLSAAALELRGTVLYIRAERGALEPSRIAEHLARADADLGKAIAIDSSLASAWGTLSRVRRAAGDVADAERKATIALAMDAYLQDAPDILQALFGATLMNDSIVKSWSWCLRGADEYPRDVRFVQCRMTLLAEDMSRAPDPRLLGQLLAESQRLDPTERAIARGQPWLPIYREMLYAVVLARAGTAPQEDSARSIANRARLRIGTDNVMNIDLKYEEALLHLVLGERREALTLLREYLADRPYLRDLVAKHPRWRTLRGDSAFQSLVGGPTL